MIDSKQNYLLQVSSITDRQSIIKTFRLLLLFETLLKKQKYQHACKTNLYTESKNSKQRPSIAVRRPIDRVVTMIISENIKFSRVLKSYFRFREHRRNSAMFSLTCFLYLLFSQTSG